MKSLFCFYTLLALAHGVHAQQGETPNAAAPVLPESGPAPDVVPARNSIPDSGQSRTRPTTTDRIISEAPATVVVKPSNPFSGFRKVDKNGDGTISLSELISAFHKADETGDERLNLEEFQRDIVDQPIDEGGAPDEPRIIIQESEPKPAAEGIRPANPKTDANKPNAGKASTTKRGGSKSGGAESEDTDVDVDIDGPNNSSSNNPRRTGDSNKEPDSQSDEGSDATELTDESTAPTGDNAEDTDGAAAESNKSKQGETSNTDTRNKKPAAAQGGSGKQ